MEAPLRAENATLKERQENELRELERQIAQTWEQSWNRAGSRANDNRRERKGGRTDKARGRDEQGGGRVRVRGYD